MLIVIGITLFVFAMSGLFGWMLCEGAEAALGRFPKGADQ